VTGRRVEPASSGSRAPTGRRADTAGYAADTSSRPSAAPIPPAAVDAPRRLVRTVRNRDHPAGAKTIHPTVAPAQETPPNARCRTGTQRQAPTPNDATNTSRAATRRCPRYQQLRVALVSGRRSPEKYGAQSDCARARGSSAPSGRAPGYPYPPTPIFTEAGVPTRRPFARHKFPSPGKLKFGFGGLTCVFVCLRFTYSRTAVTRKTTHLSTQQTTIGAVRER
jgi:hypothetical protein